MALVPGSVGAVLLAGGRCPPDLAAAAGVECRALLPFRGRPMAEWVLEAVRAAPSIGRIVAVGDLPQTLGCTIAPGGRTILESIRNGTEALGGDSFLLVSADIPFLTPDAVEDVCRKSVESGAWFCYSIIPMSACEAAFPGVKRTAVRIREGYFTGGNITYLHRQFLEENWARVEAAHAARKSPLRLAAMLGPGMTLRLLIGWLAPSTLSLGYLEKKASRMLGAPVKAIITEHASVGTDIDSIEHWQAFSRADA
ncbi:MAG: NTP transferase domain-containing protein [Fimbriimonadia bacterium]